MRNSRAIRLNSLYKAHGLTFPPIEALLGHEDNPGEKVLVPLLDKLGYNPIIDIARKPSLHHSIIGSAIKAPDYGILQYRSSKPPFYGMVADTKPLGENLDKWVEKLAGYCGLAGAVRGILLDGVEVIIIEPKRGVVEWDYHATIPTKDELEKLLIKSPPEYQPADLIYAGRILEIINEQVVGDLARHCHEIIRSRKGLAIPDRLYEFSKLLVARILDERRFAEGKQDRLFLTQGNIKEMRSRSASVKSYVDTLFKSLQTEADIFPTGEEINLDEEVTEEIIVYLDRYRLWSRQMDILGAVYEKFLANTMTGRELGQYFTPRPVIDSIVKMIDPGLEDRVLDPACGTGGFLISTLQTLTQKHKLADAASIRRAASHFHGIDIYADITKLCEVNLWLHGDSHENVCGADSLDPDKCPDYLIKALHSPDSHGFQVILTNPPFGATGGNRMSGDYVTRVSTQWSKLSVDLFECAVSGPTQRSIQPKTMFVELCIKALAIPSSPGKGGRLGIVVDNGLLSNVGNEETVVRRILKRECIIEAIVGLPKGTFMPYGSNTIPCFVIARRKHPTEKQGPIFRAEVSKMGLVAGFSRYRKESDADLQSVLRYWIAHKRQDQTEQAPTY